jgi:hypothetical protein
VFQIPVHGRGGQGVVIAAELLSVAACLDGHEAQAFPSFGWTERQNWPTGSYRLPTAALRAAVDRTTLNAAARTTCQAFLSSVATPDTEFVVPGGSWNQSDRRSPDSSPHGRCRVGELLPAARRYVLLAAPSTLTLTSDAASPQAV